MKTEQLKAAEKEMIRWLAHPAELGQEPFEIECTKEFDLHELHYYVFRFKEYENDEWKLSVCGGYEDGGVRGCGHVFSHMKNYNEETAVEDAIEIVEFVRSYWKDRAANMLEEDKPIDWIIHYVFPDSEEELNLYGIDAHTHGLKKHNHPELMIVLPMEGEEVANILNSLGCRILEGERFDIEGIRRDVFADKTPVLLLKESFWGEENVVILLSDENGNVPGDGQCSKEYDMQLQYLNNLKKKYDESENN